MGSPHRRSCAIRRLGLFKLHVDRTLRDLDGLSDTEHRFFAKSVDQAFNQQQGGLTVNVGGKGRRAPHCGVVIINGHEEDGLRYRREHMVALSRRRLESLPTMSCQYLIQAPITTMYNNDGQ